MTFITSSSGEGHITINPLAYDSIGAGTWASIIDASQMNNVFIYNSSGADNDEINYKVFLSAGTYSIRIITLKSNNHGILKIDVDGTLQVTSDNYNASTSYNTVVTTTGINITTPGIKTIRLYVSGKNASSSSYTIGNSNISLWRTV